jgi:two-component system phosphate regulon sensor histidine kinase PhoR
MKVKHTKASDADITQSIKYDALIESIGEGLIVIDRNGNIERVNHYASQVLGYSEEELIGRWFPGAVIVVDEIGQHVEPLARPISRALTEGKPVSEYASFLRKDGKTVPVHVTASPVIIKGKPAGAIEVFRDLTSERELDAAKDEFVSIASHQLRTPATGIRGILAMVLAGDFGELSEKQRRYVEMAAKSNDRQLSIIEDLLSVARADSGSLELLREEVYLTALITEVIAEHELRLAESQQKLEVDLAPGVIAHVDPEKIKMVVDNLINNASKYTPAGGTVSVVLENAGPDRAHICVRDTGVGIPPDKISQIFHKFRRVQNELSIPAGGTGLGLYLAQKIVRLHGGEISVASAVGQGSDFCIYLPVRAGSKAHA